MPQLIIAGIPRGVHVKNRSYSPTIAGWSVKKIPASSKRLASCWSSVMAEVAAGSPEGSHILAYETRLDQRGRHEQEVFARHRLLWLEKNDMRCYGTGQFTELLREICQFENEWRARLRPNGECDALILPTGTFEPERQYEPMWKRAQRVISSYDRLDSVVQLIQNFRSAHYRSGKWVDSAKRIFDCRGPRHAASPEPLWKYTYRCADDFHYDVRSERSGSAFAIKDGKGRRVTFDTYANVDPYGNFRGGN